MSLLTKLNQWQVAPPSPPRRESNSGGRWNNGSWNDTINNELENLRWMIEDKGWQDTIHIGKHLVGRHREIPEEYIRSLMDAMMSSNNYHGITKYIIEGS